MSMHVVEAVLCPAFVFICDSIDSLLELLAVCAVCICKHRFVLLLALPNMLKITAGVI